ncbi:hypothetical protein JYT72_01820 [Crocinitomix catalasitica]|nr:hypothetical protein [Crocinitomix catalasitica]
MRILPLVIGLLLFSCGSETTEADTEGTAEQSDTSSIIEFDLNEERLDAVSYNNRLNSILAGTLDNIDLLFASDASNIEENLGNVLFDLDLNYLAVSETMVPTDDEEQPFRDALLELLAFYINELQGSFSSDIVPIIASSSTSDIDEATLETYDELFSIEEDELYQRFLRAQEQFALENNIKLSE